MKLKDLDVSVLKKLDPYDILVLQTEQDGMKTEWRGKLAQFVSFLRSNYGWKGIIITLKPGEKLTKISDHASVQLYNVLKEKFESQ